MGGRGRRTARNYHAAILRPLCTNQVSSRERLNGGCFSSSLNYCRGVVHSCFVTEAGRRLNSTKKKGQIVVAYRNGRSHYHPPPVFLLQQIDGPLRRNGDPPLPSADVENLFIVISHEFTRPSMRVANSKSHAGKRFPTVVGIQRTLKSRRENDSRRWREV